MALTKRTDSNTVFLQAKHYCLWQELKQQVQGCEAVQVKNPKTEAVSTKYGFKYDTVVGLVTDMAKYDTERKYATRYFGFKIRLVDEGNNYVLDMPYQSQILRRFLRVAPNVDWSIPLSITIFKGKKENGKEELGVWFKQRGETIKVYYSRETPNGMPEATKDPDTQEWDFRNQHRWLVEKLRAEIIPKIMEAAKKVAPPIQPHTNGQEQEPPWDGEDSGDDSHIPPGAPIDDKW